VGGVGITEIIGPLIWAYKILRFGYRTYAYRPYRITTRPARRLYRRWYAWKHRPPTPEETRQAHQHLQVFYSYFDRISSSATWLNVNDNLVAATNALNQAKRLGPDVVFPFPTKEGTIDMTVDELSAQLLVTEGKVRADEGFKTKNRFTQDSSERKSWDREFEKMQRQALRSFIKADRYMPNNPMILNEISGAYIMLGKERTARNIAKRSLSIDPENVATMQLWQSLRPWWYTLLLRR
jgi:hypothetical protein